MLLAALGSVSIGKNCDLGLENAALGLRPRAAFSRPRSQFVPIRTSQPANNIYLLYLLVSTRTLIGQFSGPLKFKVDSVAKLFCALSPTVLNFYSK